MYKTLFNAFDDLKNKSIEYYTHNLKSLDLNNNDSTSDEKLQSEPSSQHKELGSTLFTLDWKIENMVNAANKASQLLKSTLVDTANVVKTNIEGNNIVSDFKKEQEKFQNEILNPQNENNLLFWNDLENEDSLKKQILSLSQDMRNFLRSPPDSSDFVFDFVSYANSAKELLKLDPRLRAMRFQLVPKKIKEELFWRNYFYRVSLIKQSINLYDNIPATTKTAGKRKSSVETVNDRLTGVENEAKVAEGSAVDRLSQVVGGGEDEEGLTPTTEFISDSIIKEEDDYLSSASGEKLNLDEELEKMLGDDLKEYELVKKSASECNQSQNGSSFNDDPEWDKELQEMLENQKS